MRGRTVHRVAEIDDERVRDVAHVAPDVVGHQHLQAYDGLGVEDCPRC